MEHGQITLQLIDIKVFLPVIYALTFRLLTDVELLTDSGALLPVLVKLCEEVETVLNVLGRVPVYSTSPQYHSTVPPHSTTLQYHSTVPLFRTTPQYHSTVYYSVAGNVFI